MNYIEEITHKIKDADYKIESLKYKMHALEKQMASDLKLMELLSDNAWSAKSSSGEDLSGSAILGFAYEHLYPQLESSISREDIVFKLSEYCGHRFNSRSPVQWDFILGEIEKRFNNDPSITREYKNNKEFIKGICYR